MLSQAALGRTRPVVFLLADGLLAVALGNPAENDPVSHPLEWPDGDVAELAPGKLLKPLIQPLLLASQNAWPRTPDVGPGVVSVVVKADRDEAWDCHKRSELSHG
jgi:hypothetical protein